VKIPKLPKIDRRDHLVSDGRVHCAKYGHDVSVETCWSCERLICFDVDGKVELVRCKPERAFPDLIPTLIV
jgi:hypothetical protein